MSRRAWLCVALSFGTVASLGPGCAESKRTAAPGTVGDVSYGATAGLAEVGGVDDAGAAVPAVKQAGEKEKVLPAADAGAKTAPVDRKIIYSAKLDLIVKDLDGSTKSVEEKLAQHAGRLVRSEMRSDTGARRTATFTLEVPVDKFRGLVASLKELGIPERDGVDSQDVTEEYVDIQARLKNLRQQEDKLNELLKERRKEEKLEDVIRVGDRIGEVRQQIERVEGRMKYLETRAAFSTVTLTLREIKDYQPPTAPTFGDRVARTFGGSWDALVTFGEGAVLFVVAISVWLPLIIPLGIAAVWALRWLVQAVNTATVPVARPRRSESGPAVEVIDPNRTTPME